MKGGSSSACMLVSLFLIAVLLTAFLPLGTREPVSARDSATIESGPLYLKVGWLQDFANWNPLNVELNSDVVACYLLFSTLFSHNQDDNMTVPSLATGYSHIVNPNSTMSTTIDISQNAYFRSLADPEDTSHQLTANDVKFTLDTIMSNPGGAWDYCVQNITGVYVTGAHQVRIDTEFPKSTLIDNLASIPILPEFQWSTLRPNEILTAKTPNWLIGSGPFIFNNSATGYWYRFNTAPNYHGATDYPGSRTIDFDGLLYTVYGDPAALTMEMNLGNLDAVDLTGHPSLFLDTLGIGASVPISKQATREMGIVDIAINAIPLEFRSPNYAMGDKILLDPVVRKAIGMTLDKESIASDLLLGLAEVADSVLSPGFWHKDITNELVFDPAGAHALLEAYGYADINSDGILETTATCMPVQKGWVAAGQPLVFRLDAPDTDQTFDLIGVNWVSWASSAGISLDYTLKSESSMIFNDWYKADYDIWIWSWYWDPEPLSSLEVWKTSQIRKGGDNCQGPMGPWYFDSANSTSGVAYSAFDENFSVADRELDIPAKKAIVDDLQQFIYDSYTEIPPVYSVGLYAFTDERFVGWGNWTQHIGRAITSGLLWTWFDLAPIAATGTPPQFVVFLPAITWTNKGYVTNFTIYVRDVDNDMINVTWDFGDGTPMIRNTTLPAGTMQVVRVSHIYDPYYPGQGYDFPIPGQFIVNFTVSVTLDDGNGNTLIRASTVSVNMPENLSPSTPAISGPYGAVDPTDTVTVSANASDPEGDELWWTFVFNNTNEDYLIRTNHTPRTEPGAEAWANQSLVLGVEGFYNIAVWVSDAPEPYQYFPHNVSDTIVVRVGNNSLPEVASEIIVTPPVPVVGLTSGYVVVEYKIEAFDVDGDVLAVTWDFGDGTTPEMNVSEGGTIVYEFIQYRNYTDEGTFVVSVTVTDGLPGHEIDRNVTVRVWVIDHRPTASFTANPQTGDVNTFFLFNASSCSDVETPSEQLEVRWDFDNDGNWDTGWTTIKTIGHEFDSPGTYTVVVEVIDSFGLTNTTSLQVEVTDTIPEFQWMLVALAVAAMVTVMVRLRRRGEP